MLEWLMAGVMPTVSFFLSQCVSISNHKNAFDTAVAPTKIRDALRKAVLDTHDLSRFVCLTAAVGYGPVGS